MLECVCFYFVSCTKANFVITFLLRQFQFSNIWGRRFLRSERNAITKEKFPPQLQIVRERRYRKTKPCFPSHEGTLCTVTLCTEAHVKQCHVYSCSPFFSMLEPDDFENKVFQPHTLTCQVWRQHWKIANFADLVNRGVVRWNLSFPI